MTLWFKNLLVSVEVLNHDAKWHRWYPSFLAYYPVILVLLEKSYLQKLVELPSLSSGGRLNQSAPGQPWWIAIRNQGTGHDFQKSGQIDIHQPSILWLFRADHVQAQIPWSHHLIVREDLEEAGGNPAQRDAIVGATCDPANWSPPPVFQLRNPVSKNPSSGWPTHLHSPPTIAHQLHRIVQRHGGLVQPCHWRQFNALAAQTSKVRGFVWFLVKDGNRSTICHQG